MAIGLSKMRTSWFWVLFVCSLLAASRAGTAQTGQGNLLNTAIRFEERGQFEDALNRFDTIIGSDLDTETKLEAKFRAGRIYLDQKGDPAKARPYFEEVKGAQKYPRLASSATLYNGKVLLATAATNADFDRALSEFDTVILTWPGTPAEVESRLWAGTVLERQHKFESAIINYQAIVLGFPDSPEAAAAFTRLGHALSRLGRFVDALSAYQNVQTLKQAGTVGASAKKDATLLYRLFLLKETSPTPFKSSVLAKKSESFKLNDPSQMTWMPSGDLQIVDEPRILNVAPSGQVLAGKEPSDCTDRRGNVYRITQKKSILIAGGKSLTPFYKRGVEQKTFDEIIACGADSPTEMIISTKGPDGLYAVTMATGESRSFTLDQKAPRKIVLDSEGNYYLLYGPEVPIVILDSQGKSLGSISARTLNIKELSDFTLDGLDNVYLLDKEGKFVILGAVSFVDQFKLKPLHTENVTEANKPLTNLRAIATSKTGAVFVLGKEQLLAFQ